MVLKEQSIFSAFSKLHPSPPWSAISPMAKNMLVQEGCLYIPPIKEQQFQDDSSHLENGSEQKVNPLLPSFSLKTKLDF